MADILRTRLWNFINKSCGSTLGMNMGQIPQNIMKMIKGIIILDNNQFNDINLTQRVQIFKSYYWC